MEDGRKPMDYLQRKLTKYADMSKYEGRSNCADVKENMHKSAPNKHKYKNHSVEELREKGGAVNPVMATKSEPSQKTG